MGMYKRITEQIESERKRKAEIEEMLKGVTFDTRESDDLMYELADVEQSIGELEGALMEMAEVDGYNADSYGEWLDTFEED